MLRHDCISFDNFQLRVTGEHAQDRSVTQVVAACAVLPDFLVVLRDKVARRCGGISLQEIPFRLLFSAGLDNFSFGPISVVSLTDFDEIRYDDTHWARTVDRPLKFLIFEIQDGGGRHLQKYKNSNISATL